MKNIILASASPRRKQLLEQAGLRFQVIPSCSDETVEPGTAPGEAVMILSQRKAMSVIRCVDEPSVVIAADTIVFLNEVFNKPANRREAFLMLKALSGRTHTVYTGVTVIDGKSDNHRIRSLADSTDVRMRTLTDSEILKYIETGEPDDKAGAYAIQGKGSFLVESINGDFYTVVGLPMVKVYEILKEFGVDMMGL